MCNIRVGISTKSIPYGPLYIYSNSPQNPILINKAPIAALDPKP